MEFLKAEYESLKEQKRKEIRALREARDKRLAELEQKLQEKRDVSLPDVTMDRKKFTKLSRAYRKAETRVDLGWSLGALFGFGILVGIGSYIVLLIVSLVAVGVWTEPLEAAYEQLIGQAWIPEALKGIDFSTFVGLGVPVLAVLIGICFFLIAAGRRLSAKATMRRCKRNKAYAAYQNAMDRRWNGIRNAEQEIEEEKQKTEQEIEAIVNHPDLLEMKRRITYGGGVVVRFQSTVSYNVCALYVDGELTIEDFSYSGVDHNLSAGPHTIGAVIQSVNTYSGEVERALELNDAEIEVTDDDYWALTIDAKQEVIRLMTPEEIRKDLPVSADPLD